MDDYVAMAVLTGAAFEVDSAEVQTYLVKFISGNNTAESKNQRNDRYNMEVWIILLLNNTTKVLMLRQNIFFASRIYIRKVNLYRREAPSHVVG